MTQLVLIAVVTALYLLSAQTGLQRGIKYLSHVNMVLAIALMGFLLFLGPTTVHHGGLYISLRGLSSQSTQDESVSGPV